MKNIIKYFILWIIGGTVYYLMECGFHLITKGEAYSHWTMFILAGFCFQIVGAINEFFSWTTPFWKQCVIGSVIVTTLEFITGCIVNIWLGWNVWDYSQVLGNILGQICLPFSIAWILLSGIAVVVDDWLRYWLFNEEKPHYKFI